MLPPKARGTITYVAPAGNYTIKDKVLETEFDGERTEYTLMQVSTWSKFVINVFSSMCVFHRCGQFDNLDQSPKSSLPTIRFSPAKGFSTGSFQLSKAALQPFREPLAAAKP